MGKEGGCVGSRATVVLQGQEKGAGTSGGICSWQKRGSVEGRLWKIEERFCQPSATKDNSQTEEGLERRCGLVRASCMHKATL